MRFDAALRPVSGAVGAQGRFCEGAVHGRGEEGVPAEGQVGGGDDLDEVHEVEGGFVGGLLSVVEGVGVVVVGPLPTV